MSDRDINLYLRGCNFKPSRIQKIKNQYNSEKDKQLALLRGGLSFADYSPGSPDFYKLEETRKFYESDDVAACLYSSAAPKLNNIIKHAIKEKKKSVVCVVFHNSPHYKKVWDNTLKTELEDTINWFDLNNKTVTFIEMPSWVPAKTKL